MAEVPTHKMVDGVKVDLTQAEKDEILRSWSASKAENDVKKAEEEALLTQISNEKTNLPSWDQVSGAINNAFPDPAQANIIRKIARPVYTYLKKRVD